MPYSESHRAGFTKVCFREGEDVAFPLTAYDEITSKLLAGHRWYQGETIEGLECVVELFSVDCVIGITAEEVARQDAQEVTNG